jgi:hypothetical protein
MQNTNNCINPITIEGLSSIILQFPFIFDTARSVGLNVPQYFTSSSLDEVREKFNQRNCAYMTRESVYHNTNFSVATSTTEINERICSLIEKPDGELVMVHLVGTEVFACSALHPKTIIEIDDQTTTNLIALSKKLNLPLFQVIMVKSTNTATTATATTKNTSNKMTLLHLSIYPNWMHSAEDHRKSIYASLTKLLMGIQRSEVVEEDAQEEAVLVNT